MQLLNLLNCTRKTVFSFLHILQCERHIHLLLNIFQDVWTYFSVTIFFIVRFIYFTESGLPIIVCNHFPTDSIPWSVSMDVASNRDT
jgi:hypothetical protein